MKGVFFAKVLGYAMIMFGYNFPEMAKKDLLLAQDLAKVFVYVICICHIVPTNAQ